MKASVVIAAWNEEQTIAQVVRAARQAAGVTEVIVVSDGSRDQTGPVARQAGADVIELPRNVGKAGAVTAGSARATGDVIVLLDGDLIGLRPEHVENLLRPVTAGTADMAVGMFRKDLLQVVLPSLSGQRAICRSLLVNHPELRDQGFRLERALAAIAKREAWRIHTVELVGVSHRRKEEKYGLVNGYRVKLRVAKDIISRGERVRRRVSRRTGASVLIVFLIVYSFSGLFIAQTSAAHFQAMPAPAPQDRILLVAAHNDDEVIAAGGYLAAAVQAGSEVTVVILTNGDGNRFSAAWLGRRIRPRADDYIREGRIRQEESIAALGRLGISRPQVALMGFPDRGLHLLLIPHWSKGYPYTSPFTRASAPPYPGVYRPTSRYTGEDLVDSLTDIIERVRPTIVLVHSRLDEHPDHKAAHTFVTLAIQRASERAAVPVPRVYGFVVHARDFPRPLRYAPTTPLGPPGHLRDAAVWTTYQLTPAQEDLKREAVRAYRSQYKSPYLRLLLDSFIRRNELFIEESPTESR